MFQKVGLLLLSFTFPLAIGVYAQQGAVSLSTSSGTSLGTFNTLAGAYAAIPTPMVGPVVIEMLATYTGADEVFPLIFAERLGSSSTNTITIRPAASASAITHSANVATSALVIFDGADGLILDGRPGGQGNVRAWTIKNVGTSGNTLLMRNGATYNQLRYLILENSGAGTASSCLLLGTAPSQAQGNSFNLAEHNLLIGSRHGVNVSGTVANRNRSNTIRQNEIFNFALMGVWLQTGTGDITIDSNVIYGTFPLNTGPSGIVVSGEVDTAIITRNHIYNINGGSFPVQLRGIWIISATTAPASNYTYIANNFIAMTLPNVGSPRVMGIEYSGAGTFNTRLYHNTILIAGNAANPSTSGSPLSAAVNKMGSNAASNYVIRNNLFLNTRTGGLSTDQHLAIWLNNTIGINELNSNTYSSALQLARIDATAYTSFPAYVAALPAGLENEGNSRQVFTVSTTNLQLTGNSLGDSLLGAPALVGINRDLLGNQRHPVRVYRGAHEALPYLGSNCVATPTIGTAAVSNSNVCIGDSITLSLSLPAAAHWLYQWQRSTGGSPFVNISRAITAAVRLAVTESGSYRCVAVCFNGGLTDTSNVVTVNVTPEIVGLGISSSAVGFAYTFSADSATAASQFQWNFDDGNFATGRVVSHTFTANRQHNVRVVASNSCFTDSASALLNITGVGVAELQSGKALRIWPNPTAEQIFVEADFEVRHIHLLSISGAVIRSWETSVDQMHALSLGDLAPGFYLLRAEGKRGESVTKALQRMR